MALPVRHLSRARQLLSLLLYQLGRITTYSTFGLLFGLAGRRIYVAGFQQCFSIVMGIAVLVLVILYWIYKNPLQPFILKKAFSFVQSFMIKAFHSKKRGGAFLLLGMANGLLPCAMVYVAIAGALTTARVVDSVSFMAMFGAGTLPAMMIIGYFGRMVSLPVRNLFRRSIPLLMSLMGIVLILRGLNLGIPFISPLMPGPVPGAMSCH